MEMRNSRSLKGWTKAIRTNESGRELSSAPPVSFSLNYHPAPTERNQRPSVNLPSVVPAEASSQHGSHQPALLSSGSLENSPMQESLLKNNMAVLWVISTSSGKTDRKFQRFFSLFQHS